MPDAVLVQGGGDVLAEGGDAVLLELDMATQYYASVNDMDTISKDVAHAGTSGTATDIIELRMGDGTYVPTQREVLNAMDIFRRWIIQDGLDGLGANLPPNRG